MHRRNNDYELPIWAAGILFLLLCLMVAAPLQTLRGFSFATLCALLFLGILLLL